MQPGQPTPGAVLVVDFGAQYAQLIARRVRECQVYSEIVPSTMPAAEMLARRPSAIILSGGPASVHAPGAPPAPAGLLESGVPILGICYGYQLMMAGPGRHGGAYRHRRVRRDQPGRASAIRRRRAAGRAARAQPGVDVARRHLHRGAARLHGDGADRGHPGGRRRGPGPRPVRGSVPPRGHAHRPGPRGAAPVPGRGGLPGHLDRGQHRGRSRSARSGKKSGWRAGRSAGCPAGWTRRSPRRSSSGPSDPG